MAERTPHFISETVDGKLIFMEFNRQLDRLRLYSYDQDAKEHDICWLDPAATRSLYAYLGNFT